MCGTGGNPVPGQIGSWYRQWTLVERLYVEFARSFGMTDSELFVCRVLLTRPDIPQHELSAELNLPKQTLSSLLAGMERKGLIARGSSGKDRRSRLVRLTGPGEVMAGRVLACLNRAEEQAFLALPEWGRETFTSMNEALTMQLEQNMRREAAKGGNGPYDG